MRKERQARVRTPVLQLSAFVRATCQCSSFFISIQSNTTPSCRLRWLYPGWLEFRSLQQLPNHIFLRAHVEQIDMEQYVQVTSVFVFSHFPLKCFRVIQFM